MDKNTLTLIETLARGWRDALEQVELMALARETAETTACQYAYRAGRAEQETENIRQQLPVIPSVDADQQRRIARKRKRTMLLVRPCDPEAFREWVVGIYQSVGYNKPKASRRVADEFRHPSAPIPGYEGFDHSLGIVPIAANTPNVWAILSDYRTGQYTPITGSADEM